MTDPQTQHQSNANPEAHSVIPDSAEKDPVLLRLVYMVFFYLIYSLSRFVVAFLAIFQSVYVLITGEPQSDLRRFGIGLGRYAQHIVTYLSWSSDDKPFPFADWPNDRKEP